MGGERRKAGEFRIFSDTKVAAALVVRGVELFITGVPRGGVLLPDARCAVRTVDGVAGERPGTPWVARGVVLALSSAPVCLARGVVS